MNKVISISTLVVIGGCASWYLNGAKLADRDYAAGQKGGFKIDACFSLADHASVPGPTATYHFVTDEGKGGLFERATDGSGSLIQNRWTEPDGDHYFTWVQRSGWEYVFPKNAAPARLVYSGVEVMTAPDGSKRPGTSPSFKCDLIPLPGGQ